MKKNKITENDGVSYLASLMNIEGYKKGIGMGLTFLIDEHKLSDSAITIFIYNSTLYKYIMPETIDSINSDVSDKYDYKYVLGVTLRDIDGNVEIVYKRIINGLSGLFIAEVMLDHEYGFSETMKKKKNFNNVHDWKILSVKIFTEQFHNPRRFDIYDSQIYSNAFISNKVDEYDRVLRENSFIGRMLNTDQFDDIFINNITKVGFSIELCPFYNCQSIFEIGMNSVSDNIFDIEARYFKMLLQHEYLNTNSPESYYNSFVNKIWIQKAIEEDE